MVQSFLVVAVMSDDTNTLVYEEGPSEEALVMAGAFQNGDIVASRYLCCPVQTIYHLSKKVPQSLTPLNN
jgi:hypothetical protein